MATAHRIVGKQGELQEQQEEEQAKEPYQPLNVLGGVREKGFGDGAVAGKSSTVSLPRPSVIPFPVARHRSQGPHWAPPCKAETVPLPEDAEELGAEALAALAKPLVRKKKPGLQLSRWKTEQTSKNAQETDTREKLAPPPPAEQAPQGEETKAPSGRDMIEAVQRPRVTFTLPTEKTADGVLVGSSKPENYAEMSRLRRDSGASGRGTVTTTGVEKAKSGSELETIDAENRAAIASMSAAEVAEAQAELMSRLKPGVLDMLRKRGFKKDLKEHKDTKGRDELQPQKSQKQEEKMKDPEKQESSENGASGNGATTQEMPNLNGEETELPAPAPRQGIFPQTEEGSGWSKSWTERVEAVRHYRFGLQGNLVDIDEAPTENTSGAAPDAQQLSIQSIAERDYLRSEGDPAALGYTLKEAADLVRSTVPGHRALALRLIASVLESAVVGFQRQESTSLDPSRRSLQDVDWQAVWAYTLGPEPGLTLTLRLALDDTHTTVVVSCAKALHAFLTCSANEAIFDLHEGCWPGSKLVFTAPIFRRNTKQDEGFIGGGRWKYNVKASELYPFVRTASSQEEDAEGKETVGDDATVASKDCAAGLIRMGLLPRIRYILEVEKVKAAEEPLLSVVIALARHSPAAAEAVMKCPRLVDAVIQRFLLTNEDLDASDRSARFAHIKAIQLLKVLSEASRSNCTRFSESGALQMAQSELYKQGLLSQSHPRLGDAVCSTIVESLRLWGICIHYKMGISVFTDMYPTLCFWLSPLTLEEISSNKNDGALRLAHESYSLLERLARTLPRLHSNQEDMSDGEDPDEQIWTWRVAVPLVETALGWLSTERIDTIVTQINDTRQGNNNSRVKLIGTLASVLHFLATVSEKIVDEEDISQTPFIPTFVPRLGLLLATDGFVDYKNVSETDGAQPEKRTGSLFGNLCLIRHVKDEEMALAATCCLQAVVRIFNVIDQVIKAAQAQSGSIAMSGESTRAHKTLDCGLVLSAGREFRTLLKCVGDEVIANTYLLQSTEVNGRGGPAPGLGLGWGALGGGAWSRRVLVAQATARLLTELLEVVPLDTHRTEPTSDSRTESTTGSDLVQRDGDKSKPYTSELMWRISCGFGIAALAGPEDGELVKRACTNILLDPITLTALTKIVDNTLEEFGSVMRALGLSREALCKVVPEKASGFLVEHYVRTWTSKKKHKSVKSAGDSNLKGILKKPGSRLATVQEDGNTRGSLGRNLVREWARQRLPLPPHWLLSPMATNITQLLFRSQGGDDAFGVLSMVDEDKKAKMEDVVKSGLSWLLGLESLTLSTAQSTSSPLSSIPLVRKVHALSSLFVLGGDVFLQEEVRTTVGALQELYGRQLNTPAPQREDQDEATAEGPATLNFERGIDGNYTSFAESLGEQFGASSFGDLVFARQVAVYLRQGVPDTIRLVLWRVVADAQALRLLPPLAQCCGQPSGYLYPFERNDEVVGAYVSAWTSGALDTAAAQASLSFALSLHHIAGFLFGGPDLVRESLAIKKVARTLVRSSMRKSQQQAALTKLLVYQPPPPTQNPPGTSAPLDSKELEKRVSLLLEACEGDRALLAQVERLQRLAAAVQSDTTNREAQLS